MFHENMTAIDLGVCSVLHGNTRLHKAENNQLWAKPQPHQQPIREGTYTKDDFDDINKADDNASALTVWPHQLRFSGPHVQQLHLRNNSNLPIEFTADFLPQFVTVRPSRGIVPAGSDVTLDVNAETAGNGVISVIGNGESIHVTVHAELQQHHSHQHDPPAHEQVHQTQHTSAAAVVVDESPFVLVPERIEFPSIEAGRSIQRLVTLENKSSHSFAWAITPLAPAYVKV